MLKGEYERRTFIQVQRSCQVRCRDPFFVNSPAFHSCTSRKSLPQKGRGQSEPAGSKTESQAFRFPRLCLGLPAGLAFRGTIRLADQFGICNSLAANGADSKIKAFSIRQFPMIEPKHLLIAVGLQVERFNRNIRALQRAFQKAPEVLQTI